MSNGYFWRWYSHWKFKVYVWVIIKVFSSPSKISISSTSWTPLLVNFPSLITATCVTHSPFPYSPSRVLSCDISLFYQLLSDLIIIWLIILMKSRAYILFSKSDVDVSFSCPSSPIPTWFIHSFISPLYWNQPYLLHTIVSAQCRWTFWIAAQEMDLFE